MWESNIVIMKAITKQHFSLAFYIGGDDTWPVEEGIIPYDMLLYTSQNYASISILYRKTTRKLAFCIANNTFLLVISIEKKYNITNKLVLWNGMII